MSGRIQSHDPTDFYAHDLSALPLANTESMPQPSLSELWTAGVDAARDERSNSERDRIKEAYRPLLEVLNQGRPARFWRTDADGSHAFGNPGEWAPQGEGGAGEREREEALIWGEIARRRATDPNAFPDVPATVDAFHAQLLEAAKVKRARANATIARNQSTLGTVVRFAGGAVESMDDPLQVATLAIGGAGKTIAQRILVEGAANAAVEAVQQPSLAIRRAELGDPMTVGDAAENVGAAAIVGGVFQGVLAEPAEALLRRATRNAAPTPAEKAAGHVLEREQEVEAINPYTAGAGAEEHAERLNRARDALSAEPGIASIAPPPVVPSALPRDEFKARVRRAESGGNDLAQAASSSAFGRYQFTKDTWRNYYVRRFGRQGLSDEQIHAKRADAALQERLMDDLTADNAAALARIGARETPGNLYLMHFAGQGGASAILRAAPDTPIERVLGERAVAANAFLRGKTTADVTEWAARKMGGRAEAPTLRRTLFDSDEEFAAAQRALDEEDAAIARSRESNGPRSDEPDDLAQASPVEGGIRVGEEPRSWDLIPAAEPVRAISPEHREAVRAYIANPRKSLDADRLAAAIDVTPEEARRVLAAVASERKSGIVAAGEGFRRTSVQRTPDDLIRFLAKAGGVADNEGHSLLKGRGLQKTVPGVGKLIRQDGMSLDYAREMAAEAGYFHNLGPDEALSETTIADFLDLLETAQDGGHYAIGDILDAHELAREKDLKVELDALRGRIDDHAMDLGLTLSRRELLQAAEQVRRAGSDIPRAVEYVTHNKEALKGYDDPATGNGARTTLESLEHDFRMDVATNPDATMRLSEDAGEQRFADVLEDLEADASALAAARKCMVPA